MTTQIAREETHSRHMGYSSRLAPRVLLYASSDRIIHTTAFVTPVVDHWLERQEGRTVITNNKNNNNTNNNNNDDDNNNNNNNNSNNNNKNNNNNNINSFYLELTKIRVNIKL